MAKQVFSTPDLVRLIYSFGDSDHRKFTYNLRWDLRPFPDVFIMQYMDRQVDSAIYGYSIQEYLYEYSTKKIMQLLNMYKRCYCCQRHNIGKPILIGNLVSVPSQMVYESTSSNCQCKCRKLSRIFIRHMFIRIKNDSD